MPFDKSHLRECPTLYPKAEEFDDPILYMSREDIKELGNKYGLLKIVPPAPWKPLFSLSPSFRFHTRIQKLSDLGITTRCRKFFVETLNRFLSMSGRPAINEWLMEKSGKVHCYDLYLAMNKIAPDAKSFGELSPEKIAALNLEFHLPSNSKLLVREYRKKILPYAEYLLSNGDNFDFPVAKPGDTEMCVVCKKSHSPTTTLLCDNCDDQFHMKCLRPPLDQVPKGSWYCKKCLIGTGEYGFEENSALKFTLQEFFDHCRNFENQFSASFGKSGQRLSLDEIEQIFWSLVDEENSQIKVMYGADIHNSKPGEFTGFPTSDYISPGLENLEGSPQYQGMRQLHDIYSNHPWNLNRLPFAKGSLLNHIDTEISGMTVPWIYVGSLLSTFCWHVEDHYTLSANYCHFGNTKKWYGIASLYADKFEKYLKTLAPHLFQRQPDLLHQLVTLISPSKLAEIGIPCVYADQNPNEFVITFPRVYHAGFNSGFNFNEAVNFTMDSWFDFGDRSIDDYKLIKKENVFDHYNLIENILKKFAMTSHSWVTRSDLVAKCISSYENYLNKQTKLVENLASDRLLKVVFSSDKQKEVKREEHSRLVTMEVPESKAYDDDDNLCDICRVAISFQYCEIANKSHRFGKWNNVRSKKYLELDSGDEISSKNHSHHIIKKEENMGTVEGIAMSRAAETMDNSQRNLQKKSNLSDHFQALIKQAKGKQEKGEYKSDSVNKRRRLRQKGVNNPIQPIIDTNTEIGSFGRISQIKKVNNSSLLRSLNQLDVIKLCLECTVNMCGERGEKVPKGSQISMKREFTEMRQLLASAKCQHKSLMAKISQR